MNSNKSITFLCWNTLYDSSLKKGEKIKNNNSPLPSINKDHISSFEKPFFFGNNLKSQILMTNVSTFHDGHIKCGGLDVTHYHTMGPISFMYRSIFYFSKLLTIGLGSLILYSLFHVDIDQYHPTLIWHNCSQKMLDCAYQTCFKILPKFSKMNLFLCHQSKVHH